MEILNRVKNSGIVTLDLEDFLPQPNQLVGLDIKDQLWQGLVLKEKDFRAYIAETDWSEYKGKIVHLYCSADAIVPPWAYMLLASALHDYVTNVLFGDEQAAIASLVN